MRYAFNMVTMMKEKVNTHFSFPLQLNMAPYTEDFLMGDQQDQGIETCNFVVLVLVVLNVLGSNLSAVVRALVSHQCGPCSDASIDAICGLSLLLVLSFLPRGFSPGTPVFPSKTNISKFQYDQEQGDEEPLSGCATSPNPYLLFISPCKRRCRHCLPIALQLRGRGSAGFCGAVV